MYISLASWGIFFFPSENPYTSIPFLSSLFRKYLGRNVNYERNTCISALSCSTKGANLRLFMNFNFPQLFSTEIWIIQLLFSCSYTAEHYYRASLGKPSPLNNQSMGLSCTEQIKYSKRRRKDRNKTKL